MSSGSGNSVNTLGEKNPLHTIPPKMAIEALYDYKPQGPGELPFTKGDFFHVISNEQDSEWFEAYNPARNVRGMVPVPYFKIHANKTTTSNVSPSDSHHSLLPEERKALHRSSQSKHAQHSPQQVLANGLDVSQSMQNLSLGSGEHTRHASMAGASDRSSQGKNQPSLHGVVLYDFVAERTDELAASKGEHISVIAQSNHEWFVAKHIVRLGGPGLIPVSFVEIRNLDTDEVVTDVEAAVKAAGVPTVEEWKRHAADYKASSITLGDIEDPDHDAHHQRDQQLRQQAIEQQRAHEQQHALGEEQKRQHEQALLQYYVERAPGPLVVSARVDSYHFTDEKFWYLVDCTLEDGTVRRLCRYYQDFYMFQLSLLGAFEEAAGRRDQERLLPYMPGPLKYVTDMVSSQRRENLHDYVGQLLALPPYIAQSNVLQNLFAIKKGDVEADGPTDQLPQPLAPNEQLFDNAKAEAEAKGIRPITRTDSHMSSSEADNHTEESRPTSEASGLMGPPTAYATAAPGGGHQRMASVSTVGPTADNPAVNTPQSSSNSVKVKVFYNDDLIAIRVPSDIDYLTLHDRLCERLRVAALSLEYKAEDGRRLPLVNDVDLDEALHAKNKLVLVAE